MRSSSSTPTRAIAPAAALTLKWQAPAEAQLDEAVARAKEADVVVAFVGLSPQLEGEEMRIKIPGFEGGDRTSLDLPAPQQKLLEAVAATGKPLVVVLQSGSAVALNWANEHAAAVLEAWYPGVEGGTAIARTLAGKNNPAGRLPVTFYSSLDGLPSFTDYSLQGPHLSLLHRQAAVGIRLWAELLEVQVRPGQALRADAEGRRSDHRNGHRDQHRQMRRRRGSGSVLEDSAAGRTRSTPWSASSASHSSPAPARK